MSDDATETEGDIKEMRIGQDRCDRTSINEQDINPNTNNPIGC